MTPVTLAYALDAQSAHQQVTAEVNAGETKPVSLPTNLGGPVATPDGQTLFVLTCSVPKALGVLILPGMVGASPGVPVSDLSIVNNGTQKAVVTVTAIYG